MMTSLASKIHGNNHTIIYETSIINNLVKMKVHHFFVSPFKLKFYNLAQEESHRNGGKEIRSYL